MLWLVGFRMGSLIAPTDPHMLECVSAKDGAGVHEGRGLARERASQLATLQRPPLLRGRERGVYWLSQRASFDVGCAVN